MNAEKKRILVKAISNVQHLLAVADARLLCHRGTGIHDASLADALDDVAREAARLADAFRAGVAAEALLTHVETKLPRAKLVTGTRSSS